MVLESSKILASPNFHFRIGLCVDCLQLFLQLQSFFLFVQARLQLYNSPSTSLTHRSQIWRAQQTSPRSSTLRPRTLKCSWRHNATWDPRTCRFTWSHTCGRLARMASMSSTLQRLGMNSPTNSSLDSPAIQTAPVERRSEEPPY